MGCKRERERERERESEREREKSLPSLTGKYPGRNLLCVFCRGRGFPRFLSIAGRHLPQRDEVDTNEGQKAPTKARQ